MSAKCITGRKAHPGSKNYPVVSAYVERDCNEYDPRLKYSKERYNTCKWVKESPEVCFLFLRDLNVPPVNSIALCTKAKKHQVMKSRGDQGKGYWYNALTVIENVRYKALDCIGDLCKVFTILNGSIFTTLQI